MDCIRIKSNMSTEAAVKLEQLLPNSEPLSREEVGRKWTYVDLFTVLRYIKENKEFERPTAQAYYQKLVDTGSIDVTWDSIQFTVRSLLQQYRKHRIERRKCLTIRHLYGFYIHTCILDSVFGENDEFFQIDETPSGIAQGPSIKIEPDVDQVESEVKLERDIDVHLDPEVAEFNGLSHNEEPQAEGGNGNIDASRNGFQQQHSIEESTSNSIKKEAEDDSLVGTVEECVERMENGEGSCTQVECTGGAIQLEQPNKQQQEPLTKGKRMEKATSSSGRLGNEGCNEIANVVMGSLAEDNTRTQSNGTKEGPNPSKLLLEIEKLKFRREKFRKNLEHRTHKLRLQEKRFNLRKLRNEQDFEMRNLELKSREKIAMLELTLKYKAN